MRCELLALLLIGSSCRPFDAVSGAKPSTSTDGGREGGAPSAEDGGALVDGGIAVDGAPIPSEAGATCEPGALLCDDFKRPEIPGGPVEWVPDTLESEAAIHITNGLLEAIVGPSQDSRGTITARYPLAPGPKVVRVKVRFAIGGSATGSGGAYTDLLIVRIEGGGYGNFNIGPDNIPQISFDCGGCEGWQVNIPGANDSAIHTLEYTIRYTDTSDPPRASYAFGAVINARDVAFGAIDQARTLEITAGAWHGNNQTGKVTVHYDLIEIHVDPP